MFSLAYFSEIKWTHRIGGLSAALAILLVWHSLTAIGVSLPYPSLIYLTGIILASFIGGVAAGVASAGLCLIDLYQFLNLQDPLALQRDWRRFYLNAGILPGMALLVGLLKYRLVRESNAALRQHNRLVDAVESLQDAFVLFDADDRLVIFNQRYREYFPQAAHAMVPGVAYIDLVRAAVRGSQIAGISGNEEAWISERMAAHRDASGVQVVQMNDGRWMRLSEHSTREGGRVGLRADVTDLKQRELALERSEARYRAAAEANLDALITFSAVRDVGGKIVDFIYADANLKAEWLTGIPRDRLIGSRLLETMPTERARAIFPSLAQVVETGVPFEEDHQTTPGAAAAWLHVQAAKLGDGVMLSARDITQSRRMEEQLRQAQKMEAVGQLTSGLAHDFNNMLTIVMGNLELLKSDMDSQSPCQVLADNAMEAALKGAELSRRLLAFSRKQVLLPVPTDVNQLAGGVIRLLRRTLGENIHIEMHPADDLWPTHIDPGQLENALVNLAVNARDAMPVGGRLIIETSNAFLDEASLGGSTEIAPGQYVLLMVTDTGAGIAPEILDRVFDPFFTTKAQGKGSGMGLSMVYGFIRQSGGHVRLYSEPGHGTTVRLYLPRWRDEALKPGQPPKVSERTEHSGKGRTVLLVEDDERVRLVTRLILHEMEYAVLEAGDGTQALALLEERPEIDLLFSDLMLPGGMDGTDILRAALLRRPGLRALLTSGYSARAIDAGQFSQRIQFISKPYMRSQLAQKLEGLFEADADVEAAPQHLQVNRPN